MRLCAHCNVRPLQRGAWLYCSRDCGNEAGRQRLRALPKLEATGVCPQCGEPSRPPAVYCSMQCANAHKRLPNDNTCKACGKPTKRHYTYCSHACALADRRPDVKLCKVCGTPTRRTCIYCSRACASAARKVVRAPCKRCGAPVKDWDAQYCSKACAAASRPRPEASLCPVCGKRSRRGNALTCSPACAGTKQPSKAPRRSYVRARPAAAAVRPPASTQAHGISIPLREVYRHGAELGVPLNQRGDIEVVSAAMQRAEPGHPGFIAEKRASGHANQNY